MRNYEYEFVGRIEALDFGRMIYSVIWLPECLSVQLPFKNVLRK